MADGGPDGWGSGPEDGPDPEPAPAPAPARGDRKDIGGPYRVGEHPLKVTINRYLAAACASLLGDVSDKAAVVLDTPLLLSANSFHAVGFPYDRICVPNPDPAMLAGIALANPAVRCFPCTSHQFLQRCADQKAGASGGETGEPAPLPAEFHAAFLDFCGAWGAKRLAAGKKRRRDVELLFAARLLAPGGSVLGVTCAGRGGVLGRYDGALVDHTVLGVQELAAAAGYGAHPLCVVQYHIRSPMYFVAFAVASLGTEAEAHLLARLPGRPPFTTVAAGAAGPGYGRATVEVAEGWDVGRPRALRPLQGAEEVVGRCVGRLARLVLAQYGDDAQLPAVLVVDTVDGPTVAALHSEGGVQYRQMVLVTAGDTQLGSSTPPDLFVANTTVADLLTPPTAAAAAAPPPALPPPYAVAGLAWPNALRPSILHTPAKWTDVLALLRSAALPRDRCGLLLLRILFGDGHWQDDAVDYFVAGVQGLAGQHGYALHPVRACLFSGYSRSCTVVFISVPDPCPQNLRWQPLVDEARAIPKGTPPSSVPHWREEVDWDWRRRPKAPVLWHAKKLAAVARHAAALLAGPSPRRVLVAERPPFVLWRALRLAGLPPCDVHLLVADDIEAAMAQAENAEVQFASVRLPALTRHEVEVVVADNTDDYAAAVLFLSGSLEDSQPSARAVQSLLRGDCLRLRAPDGRPATLLVHAAAFGVQPGGQAAFLRATAGRLAAAAAEAQCSGRAEGALWFGGHNPSFCMVLSITEGPPIERDSSAEWQPATYQTAGLAGDGGGWGWGTYWAPNEDTPPPAAPP